MKVLLTGGLGYIGSHTAVELINAGHEVVLLDNLSNSKHSVLSRLATITGKELQFEHNDIRDKPALRRIFQAHKPDAVIHFAGMKSVGESNKMPLVYYENNLGGMITLCEVMQENNVRILVFSSSATVYGDPEMLPLLETARLQATNPYGQTKLMGEQILRDLAASEEGWKVTLLRYFNPVGAHESGTIGEDPNDIPNNLLPIVAQVAVGKLEKVSVYGDDYDTPDGSGVRDYIHVVDLAKGHVAALEHPPTEAVETYNLGTGTGYSVLEMIHAFEKASGKSIPYQVVARRQGDIASCYADASKAHKELHWKATKNLEDMCADAWKWQQYNSTPGV